MLGHPIVALVLSATQSRARKNFSAQKNVGGVVQMACRAPVEVPKLNFWVQTPKNGKFDPGYPKITKKITFSEKNAFL